MALSEQEIESIKKQIISQIDSWDATKEQKSQAIDQVEAMNSEELEEFIKKNQLVKSQGDKQECPFCLILESKIPSYKIDENKQNLAILEINPLSPGHSIIISKKHNKLSSSAFSLANKVAKRIKSKLKPEGVKIENSVILGHNTVNVIPIYKNKKLEKKQAEEKELILLQDKLKAKIKVKKLKKEIQIQEKQLPKAPRRVP